MNNPYFSIGEEVILVSKDAPHLNGDYTVERVLQKGDTLTSTDGNIGIVSELGYSIGVAFTRYDSWCQSALRKKHKPSDESFTNMISNLNKELVDG